MGGEVKILLVEDDEDDYVLVRDLLSEISTARHTLEWAASYEAAAEAMGRGGHDVYLFDYRLGARNGLELLQAAMERGCQAPIIFLVGEGDYEIDVEAMRSGAADYLVKGQINGPLLERSLRYAMERKRVERTLKESERKLKFLSAKLLLSQEKERKWIAQELHDSIGQMLSAMKMALQTKIGQMDAGRAPEGVNLEEILSMLQNTIEETRRIMTHLRPSVLDDLGILATMNWFCRDFRKAYPQLRIQKRIGVGEEEIPEPLKIVIFRVLQEAMNNFAKHGKGDRVFVDLVKKDRGLKFAIRDNGVGFDPQNYRKGLGLASMKERVELSGGIFALESRPGGGTVIRATWPAMPEKDGQEGVILSPPAFFQDVPGDFQTIPPLRKMSGGE